MDPFDLPAEVAEAIAGMVEFCREQVAPESSTESFETAETKVRDAMNGLGRTLLKACAESRDNCASRIELDELNWFRVAATRKKIMTTLGPLTFRRALYSTGQRSIHVAGAAGRESGLHQRDLGQNQHDPYLQPGAQRQAPAHGLTAQPIGRPQPSLRGSPSEG